MVTKDKVIELVEHMPDTFSIDGLVERMLILEKIEKAQKEIQNGEGMDWEDFKKEHENDFWNDLPAYVKAGIEKSRKQAIEGLLTPHDEVKKKYIK